MSIILERAEISVIPERVETTGYLEHIPMDLLEDIAPHAIFPVKRDESLLFENIDVPRSNPVRIKFYTGSLEGLYERVSSPLGEMQEVNQKERNALLFQCIDNPSPGNGIIVKTIPPVSINGQVENLFFLEAQQEALISEGNALKALRNLDIAPEFIGYTQTPDLEEFKREKFLVMRQAEGSTYAALLAERGIIDPQLFRDRALIGFLKINQAVAKAHDVGFAHIDLKPDNVILGPGGKVTIIDWGMSVDVNKSQNKLSKFGWGTPGYAAPEQYGKRAVGKQTDVYALGIMLYEALGGNPDDINGDTPVYHETRKIWRRMHPQVMAIIEKATAFNPKDRFEDAGMLLQALIYSPLVNFITPERFYCPEKAFSEVQQDIRAQFEKKSTQLLPHMNPTIYEMPTRLLAA